MVLERTIFSSWPQLTRAMEIAIFSEEGSSSMMMAMERMIGGIAQIMSVKNMMTRSSFPP